MTSPVGLREREYFVAAGERLMLFARALDHRVFDRSPFVRTIVGAAR